MSTVPRNPEEAKELLERLQRRVEHLFEDVVDVESRVDDHDEQLAELKSRLDAAEARIDVLEDGTTTKEGKVRLIVTQAENLRQGKQTAVVITPKEIVGATGVSRRYAYDLVDGLPDEYPWILTRKEARNRQYGSVEIDQDKQKRAIVVDFELLHNDPEAVNKFTTRQTNEDP